MRRRTTWLIATMLVALSTQPCDAQPAETSDGRPSIQQIGGIGFTVAPGLTIERVAAEPLVRWPIVADWDASGRLVVAESGGVAKPIQEHNKQLLHRIVRLVDTDGDGEFDRRLVAADKLPFPEGVLCLGDDLLVSAPPNIWKLSDLDGDGVCEQREVWFDGQTITGCANDLHGPYLGRDGWIYWCKGAFAEQTHELLSGKIQTDSAAHIYRRRISGGAIEPVMSGGMDNPVEVAITPEGERFFTSTFLQHPGNGLRDGIAHAVYGGVYGKQQRVIEDLPRTGPLMPIMTQLGAAAPSGLLCLESNRLLDSARENPDARTLVAALFNLQKVTAHRLRAEGGSYSSEDLDLVVADRVDFHPTDVLEDADGSLLIVDTGGWYGLCCPTSRVDQQTAAGGIYRLRKTDAIAENRSGQIDWRQVSMDACLRYVHDERPWVARMAVLKLSEFEDAAVEPLRENLMDSSRSSSECLRSLWALSSLGSDRALEAIADALSSERPELVHAACHAVSVGRYAPAKATLEALLRSVGNEPSKLPRTAIRAAAEALGRLGDADSLSVLMSRCRQLENDPVLTHSLLYAMLEIDEPEVLRAFLGSQHQGERLAAIRVLEELGEGHQSLEAVTAELGNDGPGRLLAIEILSKHPEWIDAAVPAISETPNADLLPLIAAWREQPQVGQLLATWIENRRSRDNDATVGGLLAAWDGQPPPAATVAPLAGWFESEPIEVARLLANLDLAAEHCQPLVERLKARIVGSADRDEQLALIQCLPQGDSFAAPALTAELIARFVSDTDSREEVGRGLQRLQIREPDAKKIVEALQSIPPRNLPLAVELASSATVDAVDHELLKKLSGLPAAKTLPAGFLENVYRRRDAAIKQLAAETAQQLMAPSQDVATQVDAWIQRLPSGDPLRGLNVFRGPKAACAGCHQLGYVGGRIGPELTRIGASRTREALLEAILFPSSRIEQSYYPLKVLTIDGQIYNGLLKRKFDGGIELQLTADKTKIIFDQDIELQEISQTSIMPAGMHEVLTDQEIADLLSLLESGR